VWPKDSRAGGYLRPDPTFEPHPPPSLFPTRLILNRKNPPFLTLFGGRAKRSAGLYSDYTDWRGRFRLCGSYGTGQVYQGGTVTGEASLVKGTVGFQLGAQAFSQMVFFEDKRAYDEFTSGEFEFDAAASAVAITAGVQAKAGTEGSTASATAGPATGAQAKASYHKGMVVFTHAKGGLMYEASIGGQKFNFKPKE